MSIVRYALYIGIACLFIVSSASADLSTNGSTTYGGRVLYTQDTAHFSYSYGGEYAVYSSADIGLLLSNSAYVAGKTSGLYGNTPASKAGSFQTFCIERDEYTHNPMDIFISNSSVDEISGIAGPEGSGSHAWAGGQDKDHGDNLSPTTAWLYYQFVKGTLTDYNYTLGSGRVASAKQLQLAIWFSEGETSWSALGTQAKTWYNAAGSAVSNGAWLGIGPVRVLQTATVDVDGQPMSQDLLYVVPVPAAALLAALGLGTAGLKLRKLV